MVPAEVLPILARITDFLKHGQTSKPKEKPDFFVFNALQETDECGQLSLCFGREGARRDANVRKAVAAVLFAPIKSCQCATSFFEPLDIDAIRQKACFHRQCSDGHEFDSCRLPATRAGASQGCSRSGEGIKHVEWFARCALDQVVEIIDQFG